MDENLRLEEISTRLRQRRLPGWDELPDFELYMDQVIALVGRCLGEGEQGTERLLTSSMVNNYVKMGAMPPPVKKRYTRTHLAHLLVICALKPVMPIAGICTLIQNALRDFPEETVYGFFCREYAAAGAAAAQQAAAEPDAQPQETNRRIAMRAALRAQAEQALAAGLLETLNRQ